MADFKKEHEIAMDLFEYHDMLFQLYEFLGHDIVLKSGAVQHKVPVTLCMQIT